MVETKKKITKPATKKATKTVKSVEKEAAVSLFSGEYFYANGKRKTAIARVRLYPKGKGDIVVNGRKYKDYFGIHTAYGRINSPCSLTGTKEFSVSAKIVGGGAQAQADALRHGIAKALIIMNSGLRLTLKKAGHLTRDARQVERKKAGRRKARRSHQWVKR